MDNLSLFFCTFILVKLIDDEALIAYKYSWGVGVEINLILSINRRQSKEAMGGSSSSEENIEDNGIDSLGHVNNNVIVQTAADTHTQVGLHERLLMATYILVMAELTKLAIYVYTQWRSKIKKKYATAHPQPE